MWVLVCITEPSLCWSKVRSGATPAVVDPLRAMGFGGPTEDDMGQRGAHLRAVMLLKSEANGDR